jgi:predicted PurR-regulated permease PerM
MWRMDGPVIGRGGRSPVFAAFVLLGLAVAFAAAWALRDLLLLTFLAILFAVLLRSAADALADRSGMPAGAAVLAVILVILGLVVLAVILVVPTLVQQGRELVQAFPSLLDTVQKRISTTPFLADAWDQVQQQFNLPSPGAALSQVGSVVGIVTNSVSNLVFLFFTVIFLALSPATYVDGLRWLVPERERGFALRLLDELGGTLRSWFAGQLVMMAMVGVLVWLGLWALGVPYSLALGVLAGLLDFIPYLGPILGAAPAILVAFSISPTIGIWAVLLFVVVQQLEGNVVGPVVQESAVAIPPALLLVFLFGMGQIFGVTGLLVATPLLAVLIVLVRRIYVERCLEGIDKAGQAG